MSHICFEKMPKSWEFTHAWQALPGWATTAEGALLANILLCTSYLNFPVLLLKSNLYLKSKKISLSWKIILPCLTCMAMTCQNTYKFEIIRYSSTQEHIHPAWLQQTFQSTFLGFLSANILIHWLHIFAPKLHQKMPICIAVNRNFGINFFHVWIY